MRGISRGNVKAGLASETIWELLEEIDGILVDVNLEEVFEEVRRSKYRFSIECLVGLEREV